MTAPELSICPASPNPGTNPTDPDAIHHLVDEICSAQLVVDARLTRPALWSGSTRKEIRRRGPVPGEHGALAAAFDDSARFWGKRPTSADLDVSRLLRLHQLIGDSGEFRRIGVSVGGFRDAAHHQDVPEFVDIALARAHDGVEHAVVAAARLHVELLLIHPFRDGNGRTARLASAWLLMRAGFKSTLFTAVEQHCRVEHQRYVDAFDTLRLSEPTAHDPWLVTNLEMMAAGVRLAAWYRGRETRLRGILRDAGVRRRTHDTILLDFDLGPTDQRSPLAELAPDEVRLRGLVEAMPAADAEQLSHQVNRLITEESEADRRWRR